MLTFRRDPAPSADRCSVDGFPQGRERRRCGAQARLRSVLAAHAGQRAGERPRAGDDQHDHEPEQKPSNDFAPSAVRTTHSEAANVLARMRPMAGADYRAARPRDIRHERAHGARGSPRPRPPRARAGCR